MPSTAAQRSSLTEEKYLAEMTLEEARQNGYDSGYEDGGQAMRQDVWTAVADLLRQPTPGQPTVVVEFGKLYALLDIARGPQA